MSATRRFPWWMEPAAILGALTVRLIGLTWRIESLGFEPVERAIAGGGRVLFAFWHARMLPLVFTHRGRGIAVLVSRSRDGELITRIIEKLGFVTARGSSTRGAGGGTLEMLEWGRNGHLLAITPDGPRGPAETVKPGLSWLAVKSGLPVVPVASSSRPVWRLRSWDRFRVPPPFARVWVAYGEPIPPDTLGAEAEEACDRLGQAIGELTGDLDRRAGAAS